MNTQSSKLKTVLPASINTVQEAKAFLMELNDNGEAYHCEDDANDCLEGRVTIEQGNQLNKLMADIYALDCNKDAANLGFCPCGFLLMEGREFKTIDLTGRGYTGKCSGNWLLDSLGEVSEENDEDENEQLVELQEWIQNANDGDEYQTRDTKYIRIN